MLRFCVPSPFQRPAGEYKCDRIHSPIGMREQGSVLWESSCLGLFTGVRVYTCPDIPLDRCRSDCLETGIHPEIELEFLADSRVIVRG